MNDEVSLPNMAAALSCQECGCALAHIRPDHLRCPLGHVDLRVLSFVPRQSADLMWLIEEVDQPRTLLLKLPKSVPRRTWEPSLQGERRVLGQLQGSFTRGPYRVPQLVPGVTGSDVILMRVAEGTELGADLIGTRPWIQPLEIKRRFERVGRWLGTFSSRTATECSIFRSEELVVRAKHYVRESCERGYPAQSARRITRAIEVAAAEADGLTLTRCLVHGDFRPSHVFLDSDTVTVIDFEQAAEGWAHEDAAYFLASRESHLATHPLMQVAPGFLAFVHGFRSGYLAEAPRGWERASRLLRMVAIVRAMSIDYRGELARRRPTAFRLIVIPHYERALRTLATET